MPGQYWLIDISLLLKSIPSVRLSFPFPWPSKLNVRTPTAQKKAPPKSALASGIPPMRKNTENQNAQFKIMKLAVESGLAIDPHFLYWAYVLRYIPTRSIKFDAF